MPYELTITINQTSNEIEIRDAAGNEGGDLKVTTDDEVTWINGTTKRCTLRFRRLNLGRSPGYGPPVWPFKGNHVGNELDIPEPPPGQTTKNGGTIDKANVSSQPPACYVKYDVHVAGHGRPLDPIIIIEK